MLANQGAYANSFIDSVIEEIEGNVMISDFSGLLVGAKALKVGMDDAMTDQLTEKYFREAEELLQKYPDNAVLAEKTIDLWKTAFEYQYKKKAPKEYVDKAYALALRFADCEEVLEEFFELLKNSTEVGNWFDYTGTKQIASHLIEYRMNEYLYPPEIKQETVRRAHKKVGPNEKCPCGSGLKFKKCHKGKGIYD